MEQVQIENSEMDIWKVSDFNFLNEKVEEFSNWWSLYLVNVRSLSYLKQKTFEYCLWRTDYIFSFSFWHDEGFWIDFLIVIRGKKWSFKCSLGLRKLRFPSSQWVQARAMLGDLENLIFTTSKAIDWLIYSFFMSNLVLPQ